MKTEKSRNAADSRNVNPDRISAFLANGTECLKKRKYNIIISKEKRKIRNKEKRKNIKMTETFEQKRVSISSKRQFTIPQKFFTALGFEKEAICTVKDGMLIIVPARDNSGGEFAEQILSDLIKEGYEGESLLKEFRARQGKIRTGIEKMLDQAKKAAKGEAKAYSPDDVFREDD